jgi:hypothetical protein
VFIIFPALIRQLSLRGGLIEGKIIHLEPFGLFKPDVIFNFTFKNEKSPLQKDLYNSTFNLYYYDSSTKIKTRR